jgi:hypothetical protein
MVGNAVTDIISKNFAMDIFFGGQRMDLVQDHEVALPAPSGGFTCVEAAQSDLDGETKTIPLTVNFPGYTGQVYLNNLKVYMCPGPPWRQVQLEIDPCDVNPSLCGSIGDGLIPPL